MFKALYRKYRPKNFDDVVGQEHIVSVLRNAIEKDKIAHAYLFYGPRGTGKTSIAKIFANEVNRNTSYQSDSVDIIEIDAASNNGVDEIRDIKEAIKFAPTEGRYKVYIIDEVHMLTISAFNALLKTLEEPPAHVIFVLATTEMHKIPATILSRCQKFEFKNITRQELVGRLSFVAKQEGIDIEEEAANKIALIAKGGLRDALGMLDQASNYNNGVVRIEDVLEITSAISDKDIVDFYKDILSGDTSKVLLEYSNFLEKSKDTKLLLNDLINLSRDIVIYKNTKKIDFCEYDLTPISALLEDVLSERIYKNIEYLAEAETNMRFSTEYVSYMQICLIKMSSNLGYTANTESSCLEERIRVLESKIEALSNSSEFSREVKSIKLNEEKTKEAIVVNDDKAVENSSESQRIEEEPISIEKMIIPNKSKIKELIDQSNDKFTTYAAGVFSRILQESIATNADLYDVFSDAELTKSSKTGALLVFKNADSLFKLTSNENYKLSVEERFQDLLGVKYEIYSLQERQYEALLVDIDKKIEPDFEEVEEKKLTKVESLFQDIIIEE